MKLSELVKAIPETVAIFGSEEEEIRSLCTDSRKTEPGSLFFCIPGTRVDAHDFAPGAFRAGASALVVEHRLDLPCAQVLVSDVRSALSYMAAAFYGHPAESMHLIGLTGTKGKTTASFLVKSILEAEGLKTGLIGTVCSMIGNEEIPSHLTTPDPIDFQSLLRRMADAGVTHVVMEVSAHATALRKLDGMRFDVCGFSNLTQDHLDFFGTMDEYMAAKMRLFETEKCARAVYNADDERVTEAIGRFSLEKTSVGIRAPADLYAKDIEVGERGCAFTITYNKHYTIPVNLRLAGIFNVYNSLMAAGLCGALGVASESVRRGLEAVRSVPGRIEILETETPYRVILDYAHSPDALENILSTIRQTARARVITLFGCGGDRDREKRPLMGKIGGRLSDYCILTSDNPRSEDPLHILADIETGIRQTGVVYEIIENRREAIRRALGMAEPGDVVVLAGKGHETYQDVKGVKRPFNEKTVVRELLEELRR